MWYYLYELVTNRLASIGTTAPEPAVLTTYGVMASASMLHGQGQRWDPATLTFVAVPEPRKRIVSKRTFMGRLSQQERVFLNVMRLDPATPLALRAALQDAVEMRDMVEEINLDDPDTQAYVPQVIGLLVQGGLIAAENMQARIDAWLADG